VSCDVFAIFAIANKPCRSQRLRENLRYLLSSAQRRSVPRVQGDRYSDASCLDSHKLCEAPSRKGLGDARVGDADSRVAVGRRLRFLSIRV
jgi:hypothetical protein